MKPIHEWIADMQGSIQDPNEYMVKAIDKKDPVKPLTPSQIRAAFASLLLGAPKNEEQLQEWMHVFRSRYNPVKNGWDIYPLPLVIGAEAARDYYALPSEDTPCVIWWRGLIVKIDQGLI